MAEIRNLALEIISEMQNSEQSLPKQTSVVFGESNPLNEETIGSKKQISSLISFQDDVLVNSVAEVQPDKKAECDLNSSFSPENVLNFTFGCFEPLLITVIQNKDTDYSQEFTELFSPIFLSKENEFSLPSVILVNYLRLIFKKGDLSISTDLIQKVGPYSFESAKWMAHILLQYCLSLPRGKPKCIRQILEALDSRTQLTGVFLAHCYLRESGNFYSEKKLGLTRI